MRLGHRLILASGFTLSAGLTGCAHTIAPLSTSAGADAPCSAPAATAGSVDDKHTVFGIALGQPLALPECPKAGAGEHVAYTQLSRTSACYERLAVTATCPALQDEWIHIHYPPLMLPFWVGSSGIDVRLIKSHVEALHIATTGVPAQRPAQESITEKYGTPVSTFIMDVPNPAGGGDLQSTYNSWSKDDIAIALRGIVDRIDYGEIDVVTKTGAAATESDTTKLHGDEVPF